MRKKEKKSQKETRIQTSPRWKRKIFPKESEWNSAIKEEQKKERKKEISPSLLALYSSFQSRLARTHYSLSSFFEEEGRRSTLFDHRSGRWPGFDDTKVYETLSLLLRLRNLRIAGFLYRAFSNRTVFRNIGRGKAVLENNDILSRTSLSSCFPWERLQDFLTELLYLYIRISMHIGLSATTFCSHDKSDTITDGLNGWRKDAGDLELERRSCVGLLNDWIGIDRGSNFIYYCSPRYIYIYTYIRCTFECAIGCPEE